MSREACALIDLDAVRDNLRVARAVAARSRVMAVIKSDGYGHGLVRVAQAIGEDVDAFAVTDLDEALALRRAGFNQRIVLLQGPFEAAEIPLAAAEQLELVIHSAWQIEAIEQAQVSAALQLWLKVDTGMHRLGFQPDEVAAAWRRLTAIPAHTVNPEIGFMTHLACADDRDDTMTDRQIEAFEEACKDFGGPLSAANSAGLLGWLESHFDWVRPGIMLYGVSPFSDRQPLDFPLRPAMTLRGRIIAVKHLGAGQKVGYGATWSCPEDMPIGIVSIGYGDGYPRHAMHGTPVDVAGRRASLVGRISMDMLAVDLRGMVTLPAPGDPVTLWGEQPRPESVADSAGTIAYELFCRTPSRVRRVYLDDQ
ncbi:alanine racemase [Halorhodospira halochloris]|uniref:alanine racemase n=1 Tax=Halorhodospira halochloris TaxID=1052 RepID=UPI001EE8CA2E|nr:alanine racemase [Halorhodospira halochloris]